MEQKSNALHESRLMPFGFLLLGMIGSILSSAKWGIGIFGWLSPIGYLLFIQSSRLKWKWIIFLSALLITSVVSAKDVAPFPLAVLVAVGLIESVKLFLVYLSNAWINKRSSHFLVTLYYPAAYTCLDFLNARMGGGIWSSVANAQYGFSWLRQLASLTGIWGISFMVFWLASVFVWTMKDYVNGRPNLKGLKIYGAVFGLVMLYGGIRYQFGASPADKIVKIAGITAPSFEFLTGVYKDFSGRDLTIDPRISISSPELQAINKAQLPFIETADTIQFTRGYAAMRRINDSLFSLSQRAADAGAKIILWSEANALVFSFDEAALTKRGSEFALRNKLYLLMARAVILPGKIEQGRKFLKNEAILFGPDGRMVNLFRKNNPVPFAEASIPGDGVIPAIETPYGRLAVSICYDADFPIQMQQLGRKGVDLLLLPSGDWSAIAPYHSYMATFRGIENGNAIFRQVSGGLSIASDYRGKIQGTMDFYKPGDKLWFVDLQVGHITTLYTRIGDSFAYLCLFISAFGLGYIFLSFFVGRRTGAPEAPLAVQP